MSISKGVSYCYPSDNVIKTEPSLQVLTAASNVLESQKMIFISGQPINLMGTMNISIVNAIWQIVTGEKLEIEDPSIREIAKLLNKFISAVSLNGANPLALFLPISMTKWPLLDSLSGYKVRCHMRFYFASISMKWIWAERGPFSASTIQGIG